MNRLIFLLGCAVALGACNGESAVALSGPCGDMCRDLVQECAYAAFPTVESCYEGCLFSEEEGGDVQSQATCVEGATATGTCDTFAILECEHAHGIF